MEVTDVWMVLHQDVVDGGIATNDILVYDTEEKARTKYNNLIQEHKNECEDGTSYIIEEDETSFEMWQDGHWVEDHVIIQILKTKVL